MEPKPAWDRTDTQITEDGIKLIRYGHVYLPDGLEMAGLHPQSFVAVYARGKVPVQQNVLVEEGRDAVVTPVFIDFSRLFKGDYLWKMAELEAFTYSPSHDRPNQNNELQS